MSVRTKKISADGSIVGGDHFDYVGGPPSPAAAAMALFRRSELLAAVGRAEGELRAAAIEYDDAFASTDPKKMSDRRETSHRRLVRAARLYAMRTIAARNS
jgi:hypothetical protein